MLIYYIDIQVQYDEKCGKMTSKLLRTDSRLRTVLYIELFLDFTVIGNKELSSDKMESKRKNLLVYLLVMMTNDYAYNRQNYHLPHFSFSIFLKFFLKYISEFFCIYHNHNLSETQ